jgi:hypothetical protein
MIEAYVPITQLSALGRVAGVAAVQSIHPPMPLTVSQGAAIMGSPEWNGSGFTGAGVKVGIIDVGFQGYSSLIGTEVPVPAVRCYRLVGQPNSDLSDCERLETHGTAVAETLIDMAPDVSLYISNPQSTLDLQSTVDWMISEGVTIINHSVGWTWEGPGDGTSPYDYGALHAVDTAVAAGILWVNAAGNEGLSTWSGTWSDRDSDGLMEFDPGSEQNGVPVSTGQQIYIQARWDDSWTAAARDVDIYLVNSSGDIVRGSEQLQAGNRGNTPFEFLRYTPTFTGKLYIQVRLASGSAPAWVQVQEFSGRPLQFASPSGSISNPGESSNKGMLAVGATAWSDPTQIEAFSSQGPTRDNRIKPDVTGIDFADTVTYGVNGFPGTSQASPHVAGLAALVKQRYPGYGPKELASYMKTHGDHADNPDNAWGYGLIHLPEIDTIVDNPAPVLHSIDPVRIATDSIVTSVTISGEGFVPESVARVNGNNRGTTFVSPTELTMALAPQDTSADGSFGITVYNPLPGGGLSNALTLTVTTIAPADTSAFARTWQRTDEPVRQMEANRTWMWGEGPITNPITEEYAESPDGHRTVTYYQKSRMEITHPDADSSELWYVTNGLLVDELITGEMQVGDDSFEQHDPAQENVAGDQNDDASPTYASFGALLDAPAVDDGAPIVQQVDRNGTVTLDLTLAGYGVTAAWHVNEPGINHQVASVFWDFMNSTGTIYEDGAFVDDQLFQNPFYATGYPITEAYWTWVKVAGVSQNVLVQCFERRCLTYTPGNPDGWKVEAGNVGQHYYKWRYGREPDGLMVEE